MTAQELKNSILQMAVQGKLVPQDPSDEPASVLLERIRAEKERLIREGKIKREKAPSVIFRGADNTPYEKVGDAEPVSIADEVPFDIPDTWEWVRLTDLCEYIQRGKSPKYSQIERIPVIAQKCNQWSGFSIEKAQFIEPDTLAGYGIERLLQDDDLMWNSTGLGTLGRIAIYKATLNPYGIAVADSHVTVIRPIKSFVLSEYLYYYFANPSVQSVIEDQADGTTKQKELATATVKAYLVPFPPYNEQLRILQKLHEVLPVVHQYGVVESSCARLNHEFPAQLRKSILQLAVQGKLVPQDPSDEPASVLLDRIRAEKERLIAAGKIKRDKHESVIFRRDNSHYEKFGESEAALIDDEIPFDIPETWQWVRLQAVCSTITDGEHKTPRRVSLYQGFYLLSARNIRDGSLALDNVDYVDEAEYNAISKRCNPQKNDILISCSGSIGRICRIDDDNKYVMVRSAAMVSPIIISSEFLMYALQSDSVQLQIKSKTKQTAQANLFQGAIRELLIPLPPLNEQNRICTALHPLLQLCKFSL